MKNNYYSNEVAELAYFLDSDNFDSLPVTKKILVLNKLGEALNVMHQYTGLKE